jgi:hypothetical protein
MENINWKEVSQSEGYKSLKAAYASRVQQWPGRKEEFYANFQDILSRCKRMAHTQGKTLIEVLDYHESRRTYSYFNYYTNMGQKKTHYRRFSESWEIKRIAKQVSLFGNCEAGRLQKRIITIKQQRAANRREACGKKPRNR